MGDFLRLLAVALVSGSVTLAAVWFTGKTERERQRASFVESANAAQRALTSVVVFQVDEWIEVLAYLLTRGEPANEQEQADLDAEIGNADEATRELRQALAKGRIEFTDRFMREKSVELSNLLVSFTESVFFSVKSGEISLAEGTDRLSELHDISVELENRAATILRVQGAESDQAP